MKEKKSLEAFNSMTVSQAVIKNAVPAMISMLMVLVYNLADTFFIGQTHDAYQVAAVSLATPVFLMFMAVGTVFGIGGTSVISRAIGEGNNNYAKKVCSFCMWACIIIGIIMALFFLIFMDKILMLIGASNDTWNILRAEGQATKAMIGQIMGNLLNVVLDPLMILVLGWNIRGAAIATAIGNIIASCYYIIYFLRGKSILSIKIKDFSIKDKICSNVLSIGIPASLASVLMSISQIIMNSMIAEYGDMAVAGSGVAMKVTMITGMISMGIGQGVQPLLGYCYMLFVC